MPALVLCLLLAACRRSAPASTPPAATPGPPNLVGLHRGSAVVSRSGEALLTTSAVRAIDGSPVTRWLAPPGAPEQTIVIALAAKTRVDRLGFETGPKAVNSTTSIRAELSSDGKSFEGGGTFRLEGRQGVQMFKIAPLEASYLRVTTLGATGPFASLADIVIDGEEREEARSGPLAGCWTINGLPAEFRETGAEVAGFLGGPEGASFEGGFDGRFYRFAWIRGREYGLAAASSSRDGRAISGLVWHEQALMQDQFYAADWLGVRNDDPATCPGIGTSASVFLTYLQHQGYVPLYGLRFSSAGALDESGSSPTLDRVARFLSSNPRVRVRLVAHELRELAKEKNLAVTQRQIEGIRGALSKRGVTLAQVSFVAAGDDRPRREADTPVTRALYSVVDLEIVR